MVITLRLYIPSVSFLAALGACGQPVPASPSEDETEEYFKGKAEIVRNSKKEVHMMRVGDESETKTRLEIAAFQA